MRIKLSQQGFILVLVPLALNTFFTGWLFTILYASEREVVQEEHAREVANCLNRISRLLMAEGAGIMLESPGERGGPGRRHASLNIPAEFDRLRSLASDDPKLRTYVDELYKRWEVGGTEMHNMRALAEDNPASILVTYSRLQTLVKGIYKGAEGAAAYAQQAEDSMPKQQMLQRSRIKIIIFSGLITDIVLALFLCIIFNKITATRVRALMANAHAMAVNRPIKDVLRGNDEFAELQRVLSTMSASLAQARKKERAILDNSADIICSIDEKGSIVTASSAVQTLWHYDETDVLGKRLAELVLEEDWDKTRKVLEEIRHNGTTKTVENRIKTGSGETVEVMWSITWSNDDENFICVVHDITERRNLERMRQDFLNMITHDIRTPLSSVQAFLNLLGSPVYGQLNEKGAIKLKATEQSVELVIRLIKDMLDLEKAESGQLLLQLQNTSTWAVMQTASDITKSLAEQKNVEIKLEGADLPITVDQGRIVQVLVNLVSNAIKFAPANSAVTMLSQARQNKPSISVIDCGPGIKPEFHKRIFNKFEQVNAADATARGGIGLGLAIAKIFIEKHGGKISVESDGHTGTCFIVTFAG
jgi:PAS domain S-box-containing protein